MTNAEDWDKFRSIDMDKEVFLLFTLMLPFSFFELQNSRLLHKLKNGKADVLFKNLIQICNFLVRLRSLESSRTHLLRERVILMQIKWLS